MASLKGKIVFITGASSGIGKACAYSFAEEGADLIISARRINTVNEIAEDIRKKHGVKVHAIKLDVKSAKEVEWSVKSLPDEWKNIDILINNAGLARGFGKLYEDKVENWEEMIDTNIKGLLYVTRQIVPGMVQRKSGHVIMLGSIAGHQAYPNGSVYCATKHAVRAITDSLRQDVIGSNVRVSSIDPGMVETEFSDIRFHGDKERAKKVYEGVEPLTAEDIAESIIFIATRSPHVMINEMIIMPTQQANSYVVHRKK